jgi:hypothetical protein
MSSNTEFLYNTNYLEIEDIYLPSSYSSLIEERIRDILPMSLALPRPDILSPDLDFIRPSLINIGQDFVELPMIHHSSMGGGNSNNPGGLGGGSDGLSNPGSNPGSYPGGSDGSNRGSNNPDRNSSNLVNSRVADFNMNQADFDNLRRSVASKLRDLYINRPPRTRIYMHEAAYQDRINLLDHNVVCKQLLDTKNHNLLKAVIFDNAGHVKYTGVLSLDLLAILEK